MKHPQRRIGLFAAVSVVAGCMIGTGVFLKPATIAMHVGSVPIVLLAWLIAGLLSYAGALTYAELCAIKPATGGEYAMIREAYGNFWGYLYGWMRFTIGAPGSAASYAVGAAMFLHVCYPYGMHGIKVWQVAVVFISFFSILNSFTIAVSATVQVLLTTFKIASLAAIFILLVFFTPVATEATPPVTWPGMTSFAAALLAALWAYDGWNNLPMLGGEINQAHKNLPLALSLGMLVVVVVYLAINTAFFRVLNFSEILSLAPSATTSHELQPVATVAMGKAISGASVRIVAALLVVSALGAMNGSILASARVPYAMARDRLFFSPLGIVSKKSAIPVIATLVQGAIAALLAISGTFDELTDSVVFASWLFYGLTAATIFKIRKQHPIHERDEIFRVPFYPILPLLFLFCSAAFIIYAMCALPYLTLIGVSVILSGVPLYWFVWRNGKNAVTKT